MPILRDLPEYRNLRETLVMQAPTTSCNANLAAIRDIAEDASDLSLDTEAVGTLVTLQEDTATAIEETALARAQHADTLSEDLSDRAMAKRLAERAVFDSDGGALTKISAAIGEAVEAVRRRWYQQAVG